MNIGLLLGSFNPITVAHINVASSVLNTNKINKVLFVVAKHNPWKEEKPAPFELRCQMIETSIKPFEGQCEVCKIEEELPSPTYSYMTLSALRSKYPNDMLFIIAGTDTVKEIPKWKNYDSDIKGNLGIIEVSRNIDYLFLPPNSQRTFLFDEHGAFGREKIYTNNIPLLKTKRLDISSTNVRWLVSHGMNPYPMVTEEAYNIIKQHKLYQTHG